ncbi:hypothetical protein L596_010659 [Steinernema carpocapsae]|uniref:40S ribosomal protein SA C-terminal domain-containing protein n=1 Tax=Steinernema carpocapsae TaxID=34508 RepID=A0A4V6A765_STECR|nr:hypothetical protein L596_010659 [Steinernema carpocapsae]
MKLVDIAIPCNNKGQQSIGLMWWFLAREVLTLRGRISRESGFILDENVVMPDLYFFRDPEEEQKEAQEALVDEVVKLEESMHDLEPIKIEFNVPEPGDWAAVAPYEGIRDPAEGVNDWKAPVDGW